MTGKCGRRLRGLSLAGVVVHALFLLAAPFQHHDLICHLKTPQHCTSCTASPAARTADAPAASGTSPLADAGAAVSVPLDGQGVLFREPGTGRSPPAHL
jgi:hypothetical protein